MMFFATYVSHERDLQEMLSRGVTGTTRRRTVYYCSGLINTGIPSATLSIETAAV